MMVGNRAIRILEWAVKKLENSPIELTQFEKTLLERCKEQEINIVGYGRFPAIEVKNIKKDMKLVLDEGQIVKVESIHKVENNLHELLLIGVVNNQRQIIRKRYTTMMAYIKESTNADD